MPSDDDTEVYERVGVYPAGALAYMLLDASPALFRHRIHGGRTVELSQTSWMQHILREHREMHDKLAHIEWCLTHPDLINTDAVHLYHECCYVAYTSPRDRRMRVKDVATCSPAGRAPVHLTTEGVRVVAPIVTNLAALGLWFGHRPHRLTAILPPPEREYDLAEAVTSRSVGEHDLVRIVTVADIDPAECEVDGQSESRVDLAAGLVIVKRRVAVHVGLGHLTVLQLAESVQIDPPREPPGLSGWSA